MLNHEAVNASFCILRILIQSFTEPAKACSHIAFHAEPDRSGFWTTALATLVNGVDEELLQGKAVILGFPRALCDSHPNFQ